MNTQKLIQLKFLGGRLLVLLTSLLLVVGLVYTQAPQPALAGRFDPPDVGDRINPNPPPLQTPANGFTWRVPIRYGMDRNSDLMVDTYWRASTFDYDPNYIYPDHWSMSFWACQTGADADGTGTNIYDWNIDGYIIEEGPCELTYNGFTMQGTYPVTLTVTHQDATIEIFPQEVYIKDYFIVAIGDSLASGEGNPDVPMRFGDSGYPTHDAKWQDKRCHRSANAYPSRAAMALEYADPHTSVTFISFACSGATIMTPAWDPVGLQFGWPPLDLNPDPSKYRGTGILGSYIGNDWNDYDMGTYIPSQISQVQTSLTPPPGKSERQFDALIMSAGGNDLHFGDIAMTCLFNDNCYPNAMVHETPSTSYNMSYLISRALTPSSSPDGSPTSLPDGYAALAAAINNLDPQPANVYITQYADQTRGDIPGDTAPRYCGLLFDILYPATGVGATPEEAGPLSTVALGGLNDAIQEAVVLYASYGWKYVDGITSYEVDPNKDVGTPGPFVRDENGYGHGYCASDNWIVRADESVALQGPWPVRLITKGTLHPNAKGIEAMKNRLLYYMLPDLEATLPGNPPSDPPTFSSSFTSGGLTSQPSANGWFTGSCDDNQNCSSSQVVLQVTATGTAPLEAANVYLNDQAGCTISGVTCPMEVITLTNQVGWNLTFTNDGFYQMRFSASDSNDQIADYVSEIKVDLNDPFFDPLPGPFDIDEGGSMTLTAVVSDTMSRIINIDWDLDNNGDFETTDEQPGFSAASLDGPTPKTIGVQVTDEAGRSVTTTTTINVLNVAPTVAIDGAPATSTEGTAVALTSTVIDPGATDTFTYEWVVKKDGNDYTSGATANFSFTPDDNGSYEVFLSVTDDDGGIGTASQTISVANTAPVLSNVSISPGTLNENSSVTLSGYLADAGSADTFALTIDWGDGSTPEVVSLPAGSTSFSRSHTYADDNPTGTNSDTYSIALLLVDNDSGASTGSASVVVNNLDPSLSISTPVNGTLYAVNATVNLNATLTDPSSDDILTCSINWDDGATESVTPTLGVCTASHVYTAAGLYNIQMTGTDDDMGSKTASLMAVVYDPSAGFVTGGGWINSPAGAYKADTNLSGKATFGFVSKYKKGNTSPSGNTAFNFDLAGMEFASQSYEWLVVNQGGTNAQFKGSGLINTLPDINGNAYKFMLWASDGSPDTFRIRIWWEDADGEHDVYDNGVAQAIGGGNIVVHTGQ